MIIKKYCRDEKYRCKEEEALRNHMPTYNSDIRRDTIILRSLETSGLRMLSSV
jgi:hypothetical protein